MWETYFRQYSTTVLPLWLEKQKWNYKDDITMVGYHLLASASGDNSWREPILRNSGFLMRHDGSVVNLAEDSRNIDKISFGKTLRILRDLTGDPRYVKAVEKVYSMLSDYPRTKEGNFWHKDIYPGQVWLDGLYMGQPFYASVSTDYNDDKWDDIIGQFQSAHSLLWDEERGLYVHANDTFRKEDWCDKESGKSPCVWLRAEGWFLMALCDVYEVAEGRTERAGELKTLLKNALDRLMVYIDDDTRMFLQLVDMKDEEGNYPETSGSAMTAYALMKGERLGMLPSGYGRMGEEILEGIRKRYLRSEDGVLHLYGICASAGLGPGPDNRSDRDGSPRYYLSEKQGTDNQHGAAACMMAYSELLRRRK
ncbi:MAG: glycoside hydrolase family 105 protein [Candidatus Ornithospirochaeta sp.]